MSEANFLLAYDGPAVAEGEMEVADLAPALLAMGQLLKAAARVVDGPDADISVKVQATREGSFEVWLSLGFEQAHHVWTWWKSDDAQAAGALLQVLGISFLGGAVGLLQLLKKLQGRTPDAVSRSGDEIEIKIDGVSIFAPITVYQLAADPAVRDAVERVIADPLDREGIESLRLGAAGRVEEIQKHEGFAFRAPLEVDGESFVNRYRRAFAIVSLSFKDGQKWRLSDGHGAAKYVKVSDRQFVDRVNRSEIRFAKGDVLICEVVEKSVQGPSGLKAEYEIVKVLDHKPAPTQPPLPGF